MTQLNVIVTMEDLIQRVQKIPGGEIMGPQTIRNTLVSFAKSVDLRVTPGTEWKPSIEEKDLEQIINLGLVERESNSGTLTVTKLGQSIKKKMASIYAGYGTML